MTRAFGNCVACLYAERITPAGQIKSHLQCKRFPPQVNVVPTTQGPMNTVQFPPVGDMMGCYEFDSRGDVAANDLNA